ncbi:MAG: ABC transporter permease [Devosia sp.]
MAEINTSNAATMDAAGRPQRNVVLDLLLRGGGLVAVIILLAIVLVILKPNLGNLNVLSTLLRSMVSIAIVAIGLTLVIIAGEIDLSFGAVYGLALNALAVMWVVGGLSIFMAVPLAIAIGAAVGLVNGVLVTVVKIPAFIVTLGTYSFVQGITLWVSRTQTFDAAYPPPGRTIPPFEYDFFIGLTQRIGSIQLSLAVFWLIAIAIVFGILLHRTLFGFRLMAIGGNPIAAQLARLPVRKYKILAFMLCGALAAVAAVLQFSYAHNSQPNAGLEMTFPVFAAVIIGGASLSGGKGTIIGTLLGALLLSVLTLGLSVLSPGPHVQQMFLGAITIGAVALDLWLGKVRRARAA